MAPSDALSTTAAARAQALAPIGLTTATRITFGQAERERLTGAIVSA